MATTTKEKDTKDTKDTHKGSVTSAEVPSPGTDADLGLRMAGRNPDAPSEKEDKNEKRQFQTGPNKHESLTKAEALKRGFYWAGEPEPEPVEPIETKEVREMREEHQKQRETKKKS
jgi:hypothetical protein